MKNDTKKRKTVLFIDDEPAWLAAVTNILQHEHLNIITATSGEDAISKLNNKKPDLIVSDVRMPVMNGFELYEKVKENPTLASIPFFFMSSINDYDAKAVAKELGATGYIEKPYDTNEIKTVVNDLLTRFQKK